jgi:hypothetical protein
MKRLGWEFGHSGEVARRPAGHRRREGSPVVAQALARLRVANEIDDPEAAFRVLDDLLRTEDGAWFEPVFVAVMARRISDQHRFPRQSGRGGFG